MSLRRQWAELSLEKKLGIVVVPVVIALISVIVPVLISGGGNGSPKPQAKEASLEVIDLAVGGGNPRLTTQGTQAPTQFVDLTVRNSGDLVSVVKGVGFRVKDFALITICQAGGGLEASNNFDIILPPTPSIGQSLDFKVSQQIPPGQADRFTTRLDVREPDRQIGKRLYQLEVSLFHDTEEDPVPAGTVVVSVPNLPTSGDFWSGVPAEFKASFEAPESKPVKDCLIDNEAKYRRMIQLEGERAPELTAALLQSS